MTIFYWMHPLFSLQIHKHFFYSKKLICLFLGFFLSSISFIAQNAIAKLAVGDVISEVVYAKGSDNLTYELPLKSNIPSKSLILLYRFNEGENVTDDADSIKYVENITSYLGNSLKNDYVYLRPYVISRSKERLAKLSFNYHYAHSEISKLSSLNNITSNSVFTVLDTISNPNSFVKSDKLIITNYKGKVLAMSSYIAGFSYHGKKMPEILDYMSKVKNPEPMNKLDSVKNDINLIPPVTIPVTIKGRVLSQNTADTKPLKSAYVSVIEEINAQKFDTVSRTKTDINGNFTLILPNDKGNYKLRVVSPDKSLGTVILTNKSGFEIANMDKTENAFEYRLIPADIIKMKAPEEIDISKDFNNFKNSANREINILEHISFSSNKFNISGNSISVLDKVVEILKSNPKISLDIISHTDAIGSDTKNLDLSLKRSEQVVKYLVDKGIDKNRLKAIGKGETEIKNRCKNGVNCTEEEHAYNRRTEFHFTKN